MPLIRCPSCKNVFTASESSRGTRLACPSCDHTCRIPIKKGNAQEPAEQQAIALTPSPTLDPLEEDVLEEIDEADDSHLTDSPSPPRHRPDADDELDDDDEEVELEVVGKRSRKKKRRIRRRDGDMDRVNLGLGFYYASILALLAGFLSAIPASMIGLGGVEGPAFFLVLGAVALVDWIAPILGLIGSILCLWAPQACGARGLCIASLALNAGAMLAGVIRMMLSFVPSLAGIGALGVLPAFLMTFVGWCLFMGFLRQLSTYMGEGALAEDATAVMLRGIAILVAAPICLFLGMLVVVALKCVGAILFLVAVLFSLYGLFLFLRRQLDLIGSIRQVLQSRF